MKLWNINDSSTQFLADSPSSLLPLIVSSVLFPTIQLRGTPNPQETVREWTSWLLFVHSKLSATFFLYWRLLDYLPGHMKLSTSKNYQLNSWCLYTVKKHWHQLYGLSTDFHPMMLRTAIHDAILDQRILASLDTFGWSATRWRRRIWDTILTVWIL